MNEYCIALASRYGNFMMDKFDEQQPAHIQTYGIPHIHQAVSYTHLTLPTNREV